jgi:uncharacterized membrane protein
MSFSGIISAQVYCVLAKSTIANAMKKRRRLFAQKSTARGLVLALLAWYTALYSTGVSSLCKTRIQVGLIMSSTTEQRDLPITLTHMLYLLYVLGVLVWFLPVIAVIINYIKEDSVHHTWLESHFIWQKQTFWTFLLWFIIGAILCVVGIGVVILLILFIWYLYRIIRGWIALSDDVPIWPTDKKRQRRDHQ